MNCSEAQQALSAYHDGNVSDKAASQIEAHVESCAACSAILADYSAMSDLADRASDPEPPHRWDNIEQQLAGSRTVDRVVPSQAINRRISTTTLLVAASLLVVLGFGMFAILDSGHEHDELAVDFDHYLSAYSEDPDIATQQLFAEYPSESVTIDEAARQVGYRPVIGNSLPEGYSVDSTHVMKMPCCTCIKTLCHSDQGKPFVIFEHDAEQALWFGDREKQQHNCGGVSTTVIELDSQIAATWSVGKRSVTVVGVTDLDEIARLMPYLGRDATRG